MKPQREDLAHTPHAKLGVPRGGFARAASLPPLPRPPFPTPAWRPLRGSALPTPALPTLPAPLRPSELPPSLPLRPGPAARQAEPRLAFFGRLPAAQTRSARLAAAETATQGVEGDLAQRAATMTGR